MSPRRAQPGRQPVDEEPPEGARFPADVLADNLRAQRLLRRLEQQDVAARLTELGHPWRRVTASEVERGRRNVGFTDHGLVFCRLDGGPLHPERCSRMFDREIAKTELPRIRLHDLRHSWASLALSAGVHPKVVQERLGHASIGITLDVYSHVADGLHADAAALVAGLISTPFAATGGDGRDQPRDLHG